MVENPSTPTPQSKSPACRRQSPSPSQPSQQWGQASPLATTSTPPQRYDSPRRSVPSPMAKPPDYRSLQSSPFSFRPSNLNRSSDYPVFTPTSSSPSFPSEISHDPSTLSLNQTPLHVRSKSQPFMDDIAGGDDDLFCKLPRREFSSHRNEEEEALPAVQNEISPPIQRTQKGMIARLFPKLKRKTKSQRYDDSPRLSTNRGESSLSDVPELKSSLVELQKKLRHLEAYSEELKKALSLTRTRSPALVNHDVMVDGFLQIVFEARLSVKKLSLSLASEVDEGGSEMRYPLQALISRNLYEDFENCVFERNGSPRQLDPRLERAENFSAFVSLRGLSWREVFDGGGSRPQFVDLSRFCERKMRSLMGLLDRPGQRGEAAREGFFVAAKCVWLVHLLAFSFSPPLPILRVEEKRRFDSVFMEDVGSEKSRRRRVQLMVAPGFYVHDSVLRCKVLCSSD